MLIKIYFFFNFEKNKIMICTINIITKLKTKMDVIPQGPFKLREKMSLQSVFGQGVAVLRLFALPCVTL